MKHQNLFGMKIDDFKKKLKIKNVLCVIYFLSTIVINIILTFLRNEENHQIFLTLNIVLDVLCFFILLTYIGCYLQPKLNILKLYSENQLLIEGEIKEISQSTIRYMNLDCYMVLIDEHKFYLPENKFIKCEIDQNIKISTAYEVILEVINDEV